jgi:hypothetical protein
MQESLFFLNNFKIILYNLKYNMDFSQQFTIFKLIAILIIQMIFY